jgi:uncharacterized tellurite resistance protein B-like protein
MVKVSTMPEASMTEAKAIISQIIEKIAVPNGFAKLSPPQRKYLLAAILGSVVPADGKVRPIELEHFESFLKTKYHLGNDQLNIARSFAKLGFEVEQLHHAARYLPELLSIEDRTNLVGMLWDIALCDQELHSKEDALIYKIADLAGVPRKRVAEQQAIAAGHHRP